jgi:hypothetical protein
MLPQNVEVLYFFVAPIQKVVDIQSSTCLELKYPSRSETRILRMGIYVNFEHSTMQACCFFVLFVVSNKGKIQATREVL